MAAALLDRDADAFFSRLYFPHTIVTENKTSVTHDRRDLERLFHSVSSTLIQQRVSDYARIVQRAEVESATSIIAQWETHVMKGAQRIVRPYPSRGRLVLVEGEWLSSQVVQGFRYSELPQRFPLVSDTPILRKLAPQEA